MAYDPLRAQIRQRARHLGHRLGSWRLAPVPTITPTQVCRCQACGAEAIYRSDLPLLDGMMGGRALAARCPRASVALPATPASLIPGRARQRESNLYQMVMNHDAKFAEFMVQQFGADWRTRMSAADQRATAKQWVHARNYGVPRWAHKPG